MSPALGARLLLGPLLFGSLSFVHCVGFGEGSLGAVTCPEFGGPGSAYGETFAADARVNGKVRAFVQSAKDMAAVSAQIENEAGEACTRIGRDLGLPPMALLPRDEVGGRASGPCSVAGAQIDALMRQGLSVRVAVNPPVCQANLAASADCHAACTGSLSPGEVVASCEPGRIVGLCQGTCTGQCDGRCTGTCQGNCAARDAQGRCVGACQGACSGTCDASCHAGCAGVWQAPRCEGSMTGPSADAECDASCRAHADVNAQCTPPQVTVIPLQPAAAQLAGTLQANLPELLHAELALGHRLLADLDVLAQVGGQLPRFVTKTEFHTLGCIGAAADASLQASARVKVTLGAGAGVSGRVGAGS